MLGDTCWLGITQRIWRREELVYSLRVYPESQSPRFTLPYRRNQVLLANQKFNMKVTGYFLLAFAAVLLAENSVSGAIIEVPDDFLYQPEVAFPEEESFRDKRQVSLSGGGSNKAGTVRIDGQRPVFDNGRTKVDGNAFYQKSWQSGMPPHNAGGVGAGVTHNVWKGKGGQSLDVYGGYQRQFNTGSRHNAQGGLIYRF